jgi:predicted small secreted protein
MEGVAAASSVIAVVGLAAQVVQGCNYLRGIFDDAKNAPQELHFLNVELRIIENIVSKIDGGETNEEYQHALDFCLEALMKLKSVVEKYSAGDLTSGRRRQWGPRLAMALNKDKLEKHMTRLREAKGHLEGIRTTCVVFAFIVDFQ